MGFADKTHGMLLIIFVQCLLNSTAAYLTYSSTRKLSTERAALLSLLLYTILVDINLWILIPYTDSFAIIFPILSVNLFIHYLSQTDFFRKALLALLIGLISAVGYCIKPQAVIIYIGIYLVMVIEKSGRRINFLALIISLLCFVSVFSGIRNITYYSNGCIDKEGLVGFPHYIMLGLNEDTVGAYNTDDVEFAQSFTNSYLRNRGELTEALNRLKDKAENNTLLSFETRKLTLNYADGTFSWPSLDEDYFFEEIPDNKIPYVSGFIKSVLYGNGTLNRLFSLWKQGNWLFVLLFVGLGFIAVKKNSVSAALYLGILGVLAFSILFETGARYLFANSPLFIMIASVSFCSLFDKKHIFS